MEPPTAPNLWWMKSRVEFPQDESTPRMERDADSSAVSSSLAEFLEKEKALQTPKEDDTDIGSIIEEINHLAAQSPLGPYEKDEGERSFEEIMREAEKVYMESSKSFEQLSVHSKTSANVSLSLDDSTPTPKSTSPLPLDNKSDESRYSSESFENDVKISSSTSDSTPTKDVPQEIEKEKTASENENASDTNNETAKTIPLSPKIDLEPIRSIEIDKTASATEGISDQVITKLQDENRTLKGDITSVKIQLQETQVLLEKAKSFKSNTELLQTLEQLKDTKERNTSLELQLETLNKSHQSLKNSYDDLLSSNRSLEKRMSETESLLNHYQSKLMDLQNAKTRSKDTEENLLRQLEAEREHVKTWKIQNEKDSLCIKDLTRQVKEMERIIARKHPDSVAALIVAAKNDKDPNSSTRKVLEDRIRVLESEVSNRDRDSSRIFLEVQDKFSQMKAKYESHIEDLEIHVDDLKNQLRRGRDNFDVYTQTDTFDQNIPGRDTRDIYVQTDREKKVFAKTNVKEETHLLATIKGLQTDLLNKEKVVAKVQKDMEELRKTNVKLQREREANLKIANVKKDLKLSSQKFASSNDNVHEELENVKKERDTIRMQLCLLEDDYQALKTRRLFDLNTLHESHENDKATYVRSIKSLSDQLEAQQETIRGLQEKLACANTNLELLAAEKNKLHEEIEFLRSIYENGTEKKDLAGSTACQRCSERQKQLISYKEELDRLLATLKTLA